MNKQLAYIKKYFYSKLGLGVINCSKIVKQQIKEKKHEYASSIKNSSLEAYIKTLETKLDNLQTIENKKKKTTIYKLQQNFIKTKKKTTCGCNQAHCMECSEKHYGYTTLYEGEYFRKIKVTFDLLKIHIEEIRKKMHDVMHSRSGTFLVKSSNIEIDYISFIRQNKKNGYYFKEPYFPSILTNICFLEWNFPPLALTADKQVVAPIFSFIGNAFLPDLPRHSNKNILSLFKYFSKIITRILIVLDSQLSSDRSLNPEVKSFIKEYRALTPQEIQARMASGEFEKRMEECSFGQAKAAFKNPSAGLRNAYTGEKNPLVFRTTADMHQIFPNIALSGVLLFQFHDKTTRSQQESNFGNHFADNNKNWDRLTEQIGEIPLQHDNCDHFFSFHGWGIYPSSLSMISVLNKFQTIFNIEHQFDFLLLSELTETGNAIKFIKFALYKAVVLWTSKPTNSTLPSSAESELPKKNVKLEEIEELEQQLIKYKNNQLPANQAFSFNFPLPIDDTTDDYIEIKTTCNDIVYMDQHAAQHHLTDDNFILIALRFQELFVFFDMGEFCFTKPVNKELDKVDKANKEEKEFERELENLQKNSIKSAAIVSDNDNSDISSVTNFEKINENIKSAQLKVNFSDDINQQYDTISKLMYSELLPEIFRFMTIEATLGSQIEWITNFHLAKCKQEIKFNQTQKLVDLIHTINFRPEDVSTGVRQNHLPLEADLGENRYLEESIFAFPLGNGKNYECPLLKTTIQSNIKATYNISIQALASLNNPPNVPPAAPPNVPPNVPPAAPPNVPPRRQQP